MMNIKNKKKVLDENYTEYFLKYSDDTTFAKYVIAQADSDPGFFRWLFEDDSLEDFSYGEHREEWLEFLQDICPEKNGNKLRGNDPAPSHSFSFYIIDDFQAFDEDGLKWQVLTEDPDCGVLVYKNEDEGLYFNYAEEGKI